MLFLGTNQFLGGCFTNGFGQSLTSNGVLGGQEPIIERLTSGNRHLVPQNLTKMRTTRLQSMTKG